MITTSPHPVQLAVAALMSLSACRSAPRTIHVDGSTGVRPLVSALVNDYRSRHPSVTISMGSGLGSSARIQALLDGTIHIAMASHGVDTADLRRRGMAAHEIARSAVIIGVNSTVPVTTLTRAQICAVYSGTFTNWGQLGAPDQPIRAMMRPDNEVDAEVALAGIACMRDVHFGPNVRVLAKPEEMAAALASTPGAIGVTSMIMATQSSARITPVALDGIAPTDENVEAGAYGMARASFLLTTAPPSREVARFLEYVASAAGERVIRANGAVPVKAPR